MSLNVECKKFSDYVGDLARKMNLSNGGKVPAKDSSSVGFVDLGDVAKSEDLGSVESRVSSLEEGLESEKSFARRAEKELFDRIVDNVYLAVYGVSRYGDIIRSFENGYKIACVVKDEREREIELPRVTSDDGEDCIFCGYAFGYMYSAQVKTDSSWSLEKRYIANEVTLTESEYDALEESGSIDPTKRYIVVEN